MAKMRLRSPHYLNNQWLPEGTIVDVPEHALSIEMDGTCEETQALADEHVQKAMGQVGDHGSGGGINANSLPQHPIMQRQADGTFGAPTVVVEGQKAQAEKVAKENGEIPQTSVKPPATQKPSSGSKPVFPDLEKK